MRILAVQEADWVESYPILHQHMLESLSMAGHDVTVIDFDVLWFQKGILPLWKRRQEIDGCWRFFPDSSVKVVRPPMLRLPGLGRLSWALANWGEVSRQVVRNRPDVIVAYSISNAYVALQVARRHGVPFVYHVMDALHTLVRPGPIRDFARTVERAVMRQADHVIVVNNKLASYASIMGADPAKVEVIPMGARVRGEGAVDGHTTRASLGISETDVVLLFLGWLYTFSGLRELVTALAQRRDELQNVKLLVVGDGHLLSELTQLRDIMSLEKNLILTGRRPATEMSQFIAAADFGLLPALRNETMEHIVPAKLVEYMESGKAVISTRLPGVEAEFGRLPGILYIDQPHQVIDRVCEILETSDHPRQTAKQLGESCRQFMLAREDWDAVTERFALALQSTCADSAPVVPTGIGTCASSR